MSFGTWPPGYGIRIIDPDSHAAPDGGRYDRFNYTSAPSEGWDGDILEIYAKENETGYVWITMWDTQRDAIEFYRAYLALLQGHGARQVDDQTWIIPEGGYTDAFYIVLRDQQVLVVNGPTVSDLGDIYPAPDR